MAKIGRNDRCPCGSGKKYKQCCLAKDEEAGHAAFVARQATQEAARPRGRADFYCDDEEELALELTLASNAVIDMVKAGQLDEAEQAAHDLLERFPDAHDGYDRLGMVHEARGDHRKAADCYRKVIALVREHPEDYEPGFEDTFQSLVDSLDPNPNPNPNPNPDPSFDEPPPQH